jgi:hypothetical protein
MRVCARMPARARARAYVNCCANYNKQRTFIYTYVMRAKLQSSLHRLVIPYMRLTLHVPPDTATQNQNAKSRTSAPFWIVLIYAISIRVDRCVACVMLCDSQAAVDPTRCNASLLDNSSIFGHIITYFCLHCNAIVARLMRVCACMHACACMRAMLSTPWMTI